MRPTLFIKYNQRIYAVVLAMFFVTTGIKAQFYYGLQTEFGKNRMKYEDFFWTHYSYPAYDVYFYEEGKDLANYVSKEAEEQLRAIEKFFDYPLQDRLQFIVFNKHSDFKQSNIGFSSDDQYNIGGVTRIVGTKVILYYEGDHDKLDAQIRAGITEVLINQMLYGGSVGQMVRNNSTLVLPEWYIKGLISYMANDWNTDIDNRVKDAVLRGKYKKINSLEGADAVYAGNAFWKHVANNYGETVIPNVLYMTKVTHNVDNSTTYVLGLSMRNLWDECLQTYTQRYVENDTTRKMPEQQQLVLKKTKPTRVYSQMKMSNDGNNIVYTTNEMGQYKVWLYNVNTKKRRRIYKAEHKIDRINDYSYPLVAWHPDNKHFSFIIERKGILVMKTYDIEEYTFQQRNITGFEKILDFSYNDDGKKIVMSAVQKGQTDIYIFTAASNAYYQVTKDIYDDLQPRFVNNSERIAFVSNRPDDTLNFDTKKTLPERQSNTDVFLFNNIARSPTLIRVTNTPGINERNPSDFNASHITYLSDANGVSNRYIAHIDSTLAYVDTAMHYRTVINSYAVSNYPRSILEQEVNSKAHKYTQIIYARGRYRLYSDTLKDVKEMPPVALKNTSFRDYKISSEKIKKEKEQKELEKKKELELAEYKAEEIPATPASIDSSEINIDNYTFEGEANRSNEPNKQNNKDSLNSTSSKEFQLGKQKNYYTNFTLDYVVSQLDNTFLNGTYQKFSGGTSPVYLNPGLNAFFKVSISDLFEDYRMLGGARFSTDLSNNEYFISVEDRIKKIDKQLVLHRQRMINPADGGMKIMVHDARYTLKLPFSEVACVRGSVTYRNNRMIYMGVNDSYLASRDMFENWGSTLIEYVFDNSIKKGVNLYNGVRAKLFGEYYKQLDKKEINFFVFGFDFRHYQKIHRNFIWANRFAASTSVGNQKLIYYMGGVDNWFIPKFDYSTNISTTQNYAYQTLATNMRGFYQNARNGNSFAVINSELRLPVFNYFFQRSFQSDFIQNFQVIGFGDIGSAWIGETPYTNNEPYKTTITGSALSPVIVYVYNKHKPIIGGYGWGVRSRLWGYFVRVDRAWGMQDGVVLKPITYLSLSLDF